MDYFKIILGVILLAFFSIHVYFELRKFFRQDTTFTKHAEGQDEGRNQAKLSYKVQIVGSLKKVLRIRPL